MEKYQKNKIENSLKKGWNIINGFFAITFLIFLVVDIIRPVLPLGLLLIFWSIINIANLFFSLLKYRAFAYFRKWHGGNWCVVDFLQKDRKSSTPRSDLFFTITVLIINLFFYIMAFIIGIGFINNLHF